MLCYRCGTHVPDNSPKCPTCGQDLATGGLRQATGTFSRRRSPSLQIEGAPYRSQDVVGGRYLIKDVVGEGPLGFVFRAHDQEVDVEVALKVVNHKLVQTAEERRQFSKQLRLARKLSHPHLLRVYEEGEDRERPYFTAQYLDGLSLRKIIDLRLQKGQFFGLKEVEPLLSQVCSALDGAHKVGAHSDLKPENVLVLPDLLKVTDFGLGLAIPRMPFVQAVKSRKADRYLAPEFIDGAEVDGRVDIYAVGVMLGEMLSGLTPDGSIPELHRRNPLVPPAIEGVYRRAINSNPNARFATALELLAEFQEAAKKAVSSPPLVQAAAVTATTMPGGPPPLRRGSAEALRAETRREKVAPLPPPPPPMTPETEIPESTQPLDPAEIAQALRTARREESATQDERNDQVETEVLDSSSLVAKDDPDDHAKTQALVVPLQTHESMSMPQAAPFASVKEGIGGPKVIVPLLVLLGLGLGALGAFIVIDRQVPDELPPPPKVDQPTSPDALVAAKKAADEKALSDVIASERSAKEKAVVQKPAEARAPAPRPKAVPAVAPERATAEVPTDPKEQAPKERQQPVEPKTAPVERAVAAAAENAAAAEKEKAEKEPSERTLAAAGGAATVVAPEKPKGCPEGMRSIASGGFKMGTAAGDPMMGFDEMALSSVEVPLFCIDTYEFPNKRGVMPSVNVTVGEAQKSCESQGKRLCTEAEWEKACKGSASARWPYGDAFQAGACNTADDDSGEARRLAPAGKFGRCRSGYGVNDLSGNVGEWTAEKLIKGGAYSSSDYAVRCSARKNAASSARSTEIGFRCCVEPK